MLTDKTAIITGASKGIGEAAAYEFAKAGAKVILVARSADKITQIADQITKDGGTALAMPCDVTDAQAMQNVADTCLSEFGSIDVLVNNAGIIDPIGRMENLAPADFATLIDINVNGVFNGIHAVLPQMISQGGGTILTVGSGAATSALEGWAHYSASKAAAHHLNRVLHKESASKGIRALVLSPGTVATDMQVSIKDSQINPVSDLAWEDHIPAEWPAKALVWMCSNFADEYLGEVVSLRDETIRARAGLS